MRVAFLLGAGAAAALGWQDAPVRTAAVAEGARQPHVAVDVDGGVYVAFLRGGNVQVSLSTDGGKSFSAPVTAIDARGNAKGGMRRGPRIAVDAKKNVYVTAPVCFDPRELEKRYPAAELWLAVSADGGKTFGKPSRVNEADRKAAEALHWTAVSPGGEVHVAWIDNRTGAPAVFYKRIAEGGNKPGKDMRVAEPVCECCAPALAADSKGNVVIVFREGGRKPSREILAVRSKDQGKTFGPPIQVNQAPSRVPS